ncbi:MAG: hypothetical protein FWF82_06230, partial [Oscillospiraceae bacterium]|nr:hypothetical protein [Oscillospiraceae bacterium]
MKKKKFSANRYKQTNTWGLALCLVLTLSSLTGCYFNTPVIELISPPKLTSEQTDIFNALTRSKDPSLTLKYPKTGEYLSAFVYRPYSYDNPLGANRVMVFYEQSAISSDPPVPTIWLTFLEKDGGGWNCTHSLPFLANDIEKVEFSRLGDSFKENLVITYSVSGQPDNNLKVITFDEDDVPETVYNRNYCMFYEIGDFDDSAEKKLMSINQIRGDINQATIELAGWQDGEFKVLDTAPANPEANKYIYSASGFLKDGRPALYLEYYHFDNFFNTGIIVFEKNKSPRNIVYNQSEYLKGKFSRFLEKQPNSYTAYAFSRDIDGDGVIESAGNILFPGYDHPSINADDKVRAALWYSVNDKNSLEPTFYTYLSVNNDYVFFFPDEWTDKVTVRINHDTGEVGFWEFDGELHESPADTEVRLLSIISVADGGEAPKADSGYRLFGYGEKSDYY